MFNHGYIGVSNNTEKRFAKHKAQANTGKHINPVFANAIKKHNWNNLVKEIILVADKNYCLAIESKLRKDKEIGWNIASGGGMPNVKFGKENPMHNLEIAAKVAATKKGIATRGYGWNHSEETKQKIAQTKTGKPKKGQVISVNGLNFISQTEAAKYFKIHIRTFKKRFKKGEL
jgi:predicted GIY-YIG superfamily endonuclease